MPFVRHTLGFLSLPSFISRGAYYGINTIVYILGLLRLVSIASIKVCHFISVNIKGWTYGKNLADPNFLVVYLNSDHFLLGT